MAIDVQTREFLDRLVTRLEQILEVMDKRFEEIQNRLDTRSTETGERIETAEKHMLAEFLKWAPIEIRLRAAEAQTSALLDRITLLESRIDKLDGGYLSPYAKPQ